MAAFETAEVRWFYAGACPADIQAWFASAPHVGAAEERTDRYLALGEREDLGIKLRGGALLDVKLRTADHGAVRLAEGIAGRIEEWAKWSFPVSAGDEDGLWRSVHKSRRTRSHVVDEYTGRVSPTDPFPDRSEVCNAELAQVHIDGRDYWSLGFEAWSKLHEQQRDVLSAGLASFLSKTPVPHGVGRPSDSYSYAAWLGTV